jgi:superoxide dismutase
VVAGNLAQSSDEQAAVSIVKICLSAPAGLCDQSRPGPALTEALARDFGSVVRWRTEFAAMGERYGRG